MLYIGVDTQEGILSECCSLQVTKNNQNIGFLIGEDQFCNLFFPILYSCCHRNGVGENYIKLVDNLLLFRSSGF